MVVRLARRSVRRSMLSQHLKLKRASEHVEALKDSIDCWLGTDAYTISREIDPETRDTVRWAKIKSPPPPELALLTGDAVHNLRSALDHTVYYLAERNLGTLTNEIEEALMFPIVGNQNRKGEPADGSAIFKDFLRRNPGPLTGVPASARSFIEREQPYQWADTPDTPNAFKYHWLWVLHDLDRIDKHRRLAVTTAYLSTPYITTPEGVDPKITWSRADGPVNDGDKLVTYSGADVGVDSYFTRAVAINEGTARERDVLDVLGSLQQRVKWIVGMLSTLA